MVRSLRDSGALETKPPGSPLRTAALFVVAGLACFAVVYLGALFVLPNVGSMFAKKPVEVAYAKPEASHTQLAAISSDTKPYSKTDELACIRYGANVERRAKAQLAKDRKINPLNMGLGAGRMAQLSGRLICDAQTRPMRLCDPGERKKFVIRSLTYFEEAAEVTSLMGTKLDGSLLSSMPDGGVGTSTLFNQMLQSGRGQVESTHYSVAAVFRDLAVRGLISEADYASGLFGAPDVVKVMFVDLPAVQDVCASTQAD